MLARSSIVTLDPSIGSTYAKKPAGSLVAEAAAALLALSKDVALAGGKLFVTDSDRSIAEQLAARARYEQWLKDGKPNPNVAGSGFDPKKHKADAAALPGMSWHNAGRAVDLWIVSDRLGNPKPIVFSKQPVDKQLDLFWPMAKLRGFTPIISTPNERASESWHFDFFGPWKHVKDRRGYAEAAMAACLDVGRGGYGADSERWVQAQLHRAGFDVGAIDGVLGAKTKQGALAAGVTIEDTTSLSGLPSAGSYTWPK